MHTLLRCRRRHQELRCHLLSLQSLLHPSQQLCDGCSLQTTTARGPQRQQCTCTIFSNPVQLHVKQNAVQLHLSHANCHIAKSKRFLERLPVSSSSKFTWKCSRHPLGKNLRDKAQHPTATQEMQNKGALAKVHCHKGHLLPSLVQVLDLAVQFPNSIHGRPHL